jgi:hypothetical protein
MTEESFEGSIALNSDENNERVSIPVEKSIASEIFHKKGYCSIHKFTFDKNVIYLVPDNNKELPFYPGSLILKTLSNPTENIIGYVHDIVDDEELILFYISQDNKKKLGALFQGEVVLQPSYDTIDFDSGSFTDCDVLIVKNNDRVAYFNYETKQFITKQ